MRIPLSGRGHTLSDLTPEQLIEVLPAPAVVLEIARGTDIEAEAALIWSVVKAYALGAKVRGRLNVLELGTRQAISTRIMAEAMDGAGKLVAVDPDSSCQWWISGKVTNLPAIPCEFLAITGEEAYRRAVQGALNVAPVDIMMIDSDPHTRVQTTMWLNTWISDCLAPGGVALFHDVIAARPEIQVREAVLEWIRGRDDCSWEEYRSLRNDVEHGPYGLGCLQRLK